MSPYTRRGHKPLNVDPARATAGADDVMPASGHWQRVYSTKPAEAVSWYQAHAEHSLALIEATGVARSASIIDVGAGASTLVDDLLARGYRNITLLDVSVAALNAVKERLGPRAGTLTWLAADITRVELPPHSLDVWHDRAVFHFLTAPDDRRAYVRTVARSVKPGGHVIVATFAEDGPLQCSGLPVMRYDAAGLHAEFGDAFALVSHDRHSHHTPSGAAQQFLYCHFRKAAS